MSKIIITDLEAETGLVAPDEKLLPKRVTDKQEFIAYAFKNGFVGVDYKARCKFLTDNDYEISRQTLIDTNLPKK